MERLTCSQCGFSANEEHDERQKRLCPKCGNSLEKESFYEEKSPIGETSLMTKAPPESSEPHRFKMAFTGTAGEYFRIWIVNTFLTIVTLGIYAAWAKVRNRQYFYAHTRLDGDAFEYLADPYAILKGNLIIGGGFILYMLGEAYSPVLSGVVMILFYLILPFLIYKSLRFYAHNSAFRNIRFRFLGTLKESYQAYILIPLFLIPLTLGLIIPYWDFFRKKYFFGNFAFGATESHFRGVPKPFYKYYGVASLGILLLVGLGMGALVPFFQEIFQSDSLGGGAFVIIPILIYLVMLIAIAIIQQYLYARVTNYCWDHTNIRSLRFESTLEAQQLLWIRLTNILAIILSAGLLIPWAKVRRIQYIFDNLTIVSDIGLDEFTAAVESEDAAVGDSATDFFDIEIGL